VAETAASQIPVIYLPGISRKELRAGEDCTWALEPMIELMFCSTAQRLEESSVCTDACEDLCQLFVKER